MLSRNELIVKGKQANKGTVLLFAEVCMIESSKTKERIKYAQKSKREQQNCDLSRGNKRDNSTGNLS
jgi:hypothetical protein